MTRPLFPLALLTLLTAGACSPLIELEDENLALRSKVDSLEIVMAECRGQGEQLQDRLAAIEVRNIELDDRNRELTATLAEVRHVPAALDAMQTAATGIGESQVEPIDASVRIPDAVRVSDAGYDGSVAPGMDFLRHYQDALSAYNGRQYAEAVRLFEQLLAGARPNDMIDNCHYWLGEAELQLGNKDRAIAHFSRTAACLGGDKVDDALYSRAVVHGDMGDRDAARADLERLLHEHPRSELAGQARSMLRALR